MDLDEEYEECSYCEFTIKIKDMQLKNWYCGAYFCDNCIELIEDNKIFYIHEIDLKSN